MTEPADRALIDRLAALMLPDIGNDVRNWPAPLQDLHRNGQFRSFSERRAAVDMERRRIDARAVLAHLTELGWRRMMQPCRCTDDCDPAETNGCQCGCPAAEDH